VYILKNKDIAINVLHILQCRMNPRGEKLMKKELCFKRGTNSNKTGTMEKAEPRL
jgi:hypothetical protein